MCTRAVVFSLETLVQILKSQCYSIFPIGSQCRGLLRISASRSYMDTAGALSCSTWRNTSPMPEARARRMASVSRRTPTPSLRKAGSTACQKNIFSKICFVEKISDVSPLVNLPCKNKCKENLRTENIAYR
jgi:hypothetical protein